MRAPLALLALLASSCTLHYRQFSNMYGIQSALDKRLFEDGQTLDVTVLSKESSRPVKGAIISLGTPPRGTVLTSDAEGHLSFPLSYRLIHENPELKIVPPAGVKKLKIDFTFTINCEAIDTDSGAGTRLADLGSWPSIDVGPDRVYLQAGTDPEFGKQVAQLLGQERAALAEITGVVPPPVALAVLGEDRAFIHSAAELGGRTIWGVRKQDQNDRFMILTLVHEWTHGLLAAHFNLRENKGARYIEDGLCDLLAHLVFEQIRGGQGSPAANGRRRELERTNKAGAPATMNLVSLAKSDDSSNYRDPVDALVGTCRKPRPAIGYDLALALWLDRWETAPMAVRSFLQRLRPKAEGRSDLAAAFKALPASQLAVDHVSLADAVAVLKRHQRTDDSAQAPLKVHNRITGHVSLDLEY